MSDSFGRRFGRDKREEGALPLSEITIREIKKSSPSRFRTAERARPLKATYRGLNRKGEVRYICTSGTTPGKFWNQRVRLDDLKKAQDLIEEDPDVYNKDWLRLVVFGNVSVWCDCPAFLYFGWRYISWNLGYGLKRISRPPVIRNPRLEGTVCKHVYKVLSDLPMRINLLTGDLVKAGHLERYALRKARRGR